MLLTKTPKAIRAAGAVAAILALPGALFAPRAAAQAANANRGNVLFTQQDHVVAFNVAPPLGTGRQVGTVAGKVTGTSIVDFQFTFTGPFTFNFDNKVVITDLDGHQLRIRNLGSGVFVSPIDPAIFAVGGPLVGTYEVLAGTGKFVSWVGRKYPYRAVASNPPGGLGTVYVEVYSNPVQ
ncbi:MAG: hypothetical protein IT304_00510 [Dehalococcoidia bacterium]|nr:hypothetical protein [Dehalococcoidia bacterium]